MTTYTHDNAAYNNDVSIFDKARKWKIKKKKPSELNNDDRLEHTRLEENDVRLHFREKTISYKYVFEEKNLICRLVIRPIYLGLFIRNVQILFASTHFTVKTERQSARP